LLFHEDPTLSVQLRYSSSSRKVLPNSVSFYRMSMSAP
jgi:hypothetical protein